MKPYSINVSVNRHTGTNTYTHTYRHKHIYIQTCIYTITNTNIHTQRYTMHTHIHEYAGTKCTHIHTHRESIYTLGRSIFRNPPSSEHTSGNHHGLPLGLPSRQKSSMIDIATVAAPAKSMDWTNRRHPVLTTARSSSSFPHGASRPNSTCWDQIPPFEEIKDGKGSCHGLWILQCHCSKIYVGKLLRAVKCLHDCFIWVIMEGIWFAKQKSTFDYVIKNHPDFCPCLLFQEFKFENTGKDNK